MKVFLICALLVAAVNAGSIGNIGQKLLPSFATGHITNGEEAERHSAPYIVSLSRSSIIISHICAGSIINSYWVLTAAHCIDNPEGMGVVAGLHSRIIFDYKTQIRRVVRGKVHENFAGGVGPYDIAVLRVSEPFIYNNWVKPINLPIQDEIFEDEVQLYGWGRTSSNNPLLALHLQTVTTKLVKFADCKAALPANAAPIYETNVCSDSLQQSISACNGDSGGPLVKEIPGSNATEVGIVSWGVIPCGRDQMPTVYTRVASYIDWINNALI